MILECGDSSPLSHTATCCGALERADKSAREKAAASCRTPKFPRGMAITLLAYVKGKRTVAEAPERANPKRMLDMKVDPTMSMKTQGK